MKHQDKENLDRAIAAMRADQPETETIRAASGRVWQHLNQEVSGATPGVDSIRSCDDVRSLLLQYRGGQLPAARALLVEAHLHECVACRREAETGKRVPESLLPWKQELPQVANGGFRWMAAAAAVVVLGIAIYFVQDKFFSGPSGMRAQVEVLNGALYRIGANGEQLLKIGDQLVDGEKIRTASASHAMLRLRDGSLVEMNERAEFAVSMGYRDTTIQLGRGNIIVQAAKRASGHLYVAARDCRVSVTGTVFSVNAGIKGSRVSVIEGEVRVAEAGVTNILHSGDQLSTNASVAAVPVRQEIAWSQNLDKHLALLAEFAHLSNKLQAVQMPGLRYQSHVLPVLPANTVLYAGVPNLGDAVQQANKLFQQELQESAVLREWWQQVEAQKGAPNFDEVINYVHDLGQYLGDEIVFSMALDGHNGSPLVVAQVKRPGLKQFIEQELTELSGSKSSHFRVLDEQQLNNLPAQVNKERILILVRPDFVAAAVDVSTLRQFNAAVGHGGGLAATPFGQRLTAAYQKGAGVLLAANLQEMAAQHVSRHNQGGHGQNFERTGLADVQYLVAERKSIGDQVLNHAELSFKGQRRGLASWLAAPAPIGGLEFVSKDAGAVGAFVSKSPALMLDDVLSLAGTDSNASAHIEKGESELKIKFRQDLAETLGGEVTFALDGPLLPTPSWKIIAEVHDPNRLQSTIQQLVADINDHVKNGHAQNDVQPLHQGIVLEQQSANGLTYYTVRTLDATKAFEVTYTFTDGYIIMGPSRALVMNAIAIHQSGNSLAASSDFRSLLPQDEHANVSALLYQNLAPMIAPISQQLTPSQLQSLQQLAAETKPSVVCAYGEDNAIQIASNSRFFGLDLNTLALSSLMKIVHPPGAGNGHMSVRPM